MRYTSLAPSSTDTDVLLASGKLTLIFQYTLLSIALRPMRCDSPVP